MARMSKIDLQICRDVMTALTSKSNSKKNYLFLEPVNINEFPTYTTIVQRPMDLGTVVKNLNNGSVYSTREACFADAALCFENAETFNKDDPGRAWIVKYARGMMSVLNRERKRAEKNRLGGSSGSSSKVGSLKLKLKAGGKAGRDKSSSPLGGGSSSSNGKSHRKSSGKIKISVKPPTASSSSPTSTSSTIEINNKESTGETISRKRTSGKIKISVKTPTASSASSTSSTADNNKKESTNETISRKRKRNKNSPAYSSSQSVSSQSTTPAPAPAPAPKIKFRLKLKKDAPNSPSTTAASNPSNQSKEVVEKDISTPAVKRLKLTLKAPSHRKAAAAATTQEKSTSSGASIPTTGKSKSTSTTRTTPKTGSHSRGKELPSAVVATQSKKSPVKSGKGTISKGSTSGKKSTSGKVSTSKGSTSRGSSGKGSTGKESTVKGSTTKGLTSKGSTAKNSTPKGSTTKASTTKGSTTKGSMPKISIPKGSITKGSTPKGSTPKGSTPKGSTTKGSKTKGSKGKGTKANGSTNDNILTSTSQSPKRQQPVITPVSRGKELPKKISTSSPASDDNLNVLSESSPKNESIPKKAASEPKPIPKKITSEQKSKPKKTTSEQKSIPKKIASSEYQQQHDNKINLNMSSRATPSQQQRTSVGDSSATAPHKDKTTSQPKKKILLNISSRATKSSTSAPDQPQRIVSADSNTTTPHKDKTPPQPKTMQLKISSRIKSSTSASDQPQGNTPAGSSVTPSSTDKKSSQSKKIHLSISSRTKPSTSVPDQLQSPATVDRTATPPPKEKAPSSAIAHAKATVVTAIVTATKTDVQQQPAAVMSPALKVQCVKILSALKQRETKNVGWFLKPVINDHKIKEDYRAKIPIPMDLGTMSSKLDKNQYSTLSEFVYDTRRIFANCLRFNDNAENFLRPIASDMLSSAENIMNVFISQQQDMAVVPPYPKLLYCWTRCMHVINELLTLKNRDDGFPTAHFFLHPVSHFWGGELREDYKEKVKQPMDLGTVTANLCEGMYQSVEAFVADCRLVPSNCKAYYSGRDDGTKFMAQAARLDQFMSKQLDTLLDYDRSDDGMKAKKMAMDPSRFTLLKPPKAFFTSILQDLRDSTYTDKFTKISEPATRQFEEPVNVAMFSDYLERVETPMDMKAIEKKIEKDTYATAEDFEYDFTLIFKNCESYNLPKKNIHIIHRSKFCAKAFRKLYSTRIKAFEASGGKNFGEDKKDKKRSHPALEALEAEDLPASKKAKTEPVAAKKPLAVRKPLIPPPTEDKAVPVPVPPPRSKSPRPGSSKKATPRAASKPAPVQDAINQIKKQFTLRDHKDLESWEGGCSRFFLALKRHTWIAATRPKFIFNVPVPILFPNIKDEYAAKIKHPMDLTTAECKLLQGGIYNHADEFVADVAYVFANAVTFNQAGREEGEPMSCAYFDASRHLLRYARWLSLEHLSPYLTDDSQSEGAKQTGPLPYWKLTTSNHKDSLEEMENMVMKYHIDKGEEGDRYTWMEAECEKLLKSLRHQTDSKHMIYFIETKYPADYLSYISKPIDWISCQKRLVQRKYDIFGDIVEDLRLIFANALKYNARLKEVDSESGRVSQRAYDSAVHMSGKLESAITRMLLGLGDRIEREKIDKSILERDNEAAEIADMRVEVPDVTPPKTLPEKYTPPVDKPARIILAKKPTMWERPYEESTHEQTQREVSIEQKFMSERQQKALTDMHNLLNVSQILGANVYSNMKERENAINWAKDLSEKIRVSLNSKYKLDEPAKILDYEVSSKSQPLTPSMVSSDLAKIDRSQIKLSFCKRVRTKKEKSDKDHF